MRLGAAGGSERELLPTFRHVLSRISYRSCGRASWNRAGGASCGCGLGKANCSRAALVITRSCRRAAFLLRVRARERPSFPCCHPRFCSAPPDAPPAEPVAPTGGETLNRAKSFRTHPFSWNPVGVSLGKLAGAAGLRWTIEECFERAKDDLGLDHCEARSWH